MSREMFYGIVICYKIKLRDLCMITENIAMKPLRTKMLLTKCIIANNIKQTTDV